MCIHIFIYPGCIFVLSQHLVLWWHSVPATDSETVAVVVTQHKQEAPVQKWSTAAVWPQQLTPRNKRKPLTKPTRTHSPAQLHLLAALMNQITSGCEAHFHLLDWLNLNFWISWLIMTSLLLVFILRPEDTCEYDHDDNSNSYTANNPFIFANA